MAGGTFQWQTNVLYTILQPVRTAQGAGGGALCSADRFAARRTRIFLCSPSQSAAASGTARCADTFPRFIYPPQRVTDRLADRCYEFRRISPMFRRRVSILTALLLTAAPTFARADDDAPKREKRTRARPPR